MYEHGLVISCTCSWVVVVIGCDVISSLLLLYSQVEQALDKVTEIRQEIGEKQCECIHVHTCTCIHMYVSLYMYMYVVLPCFTIVCFAIL